MDKIKVKGYRLTVSVLALLLFFSCTRLHESHRSLAPLKVQTMVVGTAESGASMRYVGSVEAIQEVPLSLQTSGRVVNVAVKNGEKVQQGQVLLTVDDTQARNAFLTAEAALRHAQDGYDRTVKVHDKGVVSDQKMVEIESELAQAKALYDAAKQQVDECTLTAPCAGIVSGLKIVQGQTVLPGVSLCSLLDISAYRVRFTVPENEIHTLGETGTVECAAVEAVLPIKVTERNMAANTLTHTYDVTARIEGGKDVLRPGMVAIASIQPSEVSIQPAAIVIPASCVSLKPEGHTVWVVEDGVAVRRMITVDGYMADGVRVTEGLQVGDHLIISGHQKLYNGCEVIED